MIYRVLFYLILCSNILYSSLPIVFVHLGNGFPSYYYSAIKQAALFNPESPIYLLVHGRTWSGLKKKNPFPKQVTIVNANKLPISEKHKAYSPIGLTDIKYWRYTLERFYILEEFMNSYEINELVHLEGDNLIYCNLSDYLPIFRKQYPDIGIPYLNEENCTPGFIYIGNKAALAEYTDQIIHRIEQSGRFNDMGFFADYGKETGKVKPLPSVPLSYIEMGYRMESLAGDTTNNPLFFATNVQLFQGLFDALPYGIFLDGVSAAHATYKIPSVYEPSLFDPSVFTYHWERDTQGRRRLFAQLEGKKWPILVLHVHSKDLEKFASYK